MKTNKSYLLIAAVLTFLFTLTPTHSLAQENIVDRLNKILGIKLPTDYEAKTKEFTTTNVVMKDEGVSKFTEHFIVEQMKDNWGISMQNQLLFVWAAIYKQITNKNLYNGSDGNKERLNEFKLAMDRWKQCGEKFGNNFDSYIQQRIAEADRQIAEADRTGTDATLQGINNLIRFYNYYKETPNVKQEDIDFFKGHVAWIMENCKEYNIDYKTIVRERLGDDKKLNDFLKFYEIK